jgi:MscS family membrane protein
MPEWTGRRSFILLNGQWIGIFLLIFLGIVIDRVSRFFLTKLILARLKTKHLKLNSKEAQKIKFPFGILTISIVWFVGIHLLEFNDSTLSIMVRLGHILFAISLTWVMGQIVTLVSEYFAQIADQTENKLDDILIPMLTKAARVFVYCIGAVFVAHSLTIDVTNIVAGLGIGGLAFALAAKDTLSNLFGSVTVVLDRPFHIGDWVKIGNDIEGTVVQVGFRSTRIRTFYDSIITIPNNQLTNVHIDNMNQRQYRRYLTHVTVQYDTSPEKIEAYCEGIRKIIASYETTRKDYFNVYLNNMSSSSLDILVQVYWIVPDYAAECSERHRLLVDIIRLANELDIDFAFPTRTLHLYNEQQADRKENPLGKNADNYYQWGSEEANKLVANSISHKESRSSQDSLS